MTLSKSEKAFIKRQEMLADPERKKAYRAAQTLRARHRHWLQKYNLTPEDVEEMWEAQGGMCGICQIDLLPIEEMTAETRYLNIFPQLDHNHETGKVRQFLCRSCNTKLGWYETYHREIKEYIDGTL